MFSSIFFTSDASTKVELASSYPFEGIIITTITIVIGPTIMLLLGKQNDKVHSVLELLHSFQEENEELRTKLAIQEKSITLLREQKARLARKVDRLNTSLIDIKTQ